MSTMFMNRFFDNQMKMFMIVTSFPFVNLLRKCLLFMNPFGLALCKGAKLRRVPGCLLLQLPPETDVLTCKAERSNFLWPRPKQEMPTDALLANCHCWTVPRPQRQLKWMPMKAAKPRKMWWLCWRSVSSRDDNCCLCGHDWWGFGRFWVCCAGSIWCASHVFLVWSLIGTSALPNWTFGSPQVPKECPNWNFSKRFVHCSHHCSSSLVFSAGCH